MGSEVIKEMPDLLLKEDDKAYDAHGDELVEDTAEKFHLEHLTDEEPHKHENEDAVEDVERPALTHQTVYVEQHQCHKHDVDDILYAKLEKHSLLITVY